MANIERMFLVTVKLPKNPDHNPRNKVTGPCPMGGGHCTDVTGEHHTTWWITNESLQTVLNLARKTYDHVTRVEEVPMPSFRTKDI